LQLLSKRYKGQLDSAADEYIDFAVDGAVRMKNLITDLLDYSRVGSQVRPLKPTDSESVLRRALKNLEIAIEECGAKVTVDPLPSVMADDLQLERLFQNLVGNALKYRKKDAAPEIHISVIPHADEYEFHISDNGIGIPKDQSERIFAIFQRLHSSNEYSGTGIGLAVCRKIVENHGGRIWVESEPGQGSTFVFTMPKSAGELSV
jgi:light-regulated signal transduction histidine kinase (bacteriophytochrome)